MDGTKIDWADATWNPVTGCLHRCSYCYARKIAQRYGKQKNETLCTKDGQPYKWGFHYTTDEHNGQKVYTLLERAYATHYDCEKFEEIRRPCPYPFGFAPTFHRYRMDEYTRKNKKRDIFVCSMADLFGEWVPEEWKVQAIKACREAPQHRYLFLTKNPNGVPSAIFWGEATEVWWPDNMWFGTTVGTQADLADKVKELINISGNIFLSIEPIHGPINLITVDRGDLIIHPLTGEAFWLGGGTKGLNRVKWVIVGAETGNRKDKVIPEREWIMSIKRQCAEAGVSLWMKESLRELMGQDFCQDKPWWNG